MSQITGTTPGSIVPEPTGNIVTKEPLYVTVTGMKTMMTGHFKPMIIIAPDKQPDQQNVFNAPKFALQLWGAIFPYFLQ
jgi:hypothetical protein